MNFGKKVVVGGRMSGKWRNLEYLKKAASVGQKYSN